MRNWVQVKREAISNQDIAVSKLVEIHVDIYQNRMKGDVENLKKCFINKRKVELDLYQALITEEVCNKYLNGIWVIS